MNILARLLSHGFAIAVVVLLAIGLIYRGELFPDLQWPAFMAPDTGTITADSKESRKSGPETLPAQDAEPAHTDTAGPVVTGDESIAGEAGTGEPAEEAVTGPAPEIPPAVTTPAENASVEEPSAETAPAAAEPASPAETLAPPTGQEPSAGSQAVPSTADEMAGAGQTLTTPIPDSAVADEGASSPAGSDQPGAVETAPVSPAGEAPQPAAHETASAAPDSMSTTGTSEEKRPYELLAAAREAYWLHDYELAEANYRKWMELEPDNPDSYGELGNLFFSQGKWEEAASAYYEAGVRLVESGNLQQASELLEVIRGLNGSQSEELERRIKEANQ